MALDEVMCEFEEKVDDNGDGDDKILLPSSPVAKCASSVKRVSVSGCGDGDLFRSQCTCRSISPSHPINRNQCIQNRDSCLSRSPNTNGHRDDPLYPISLPSCRNLTHSSTARLHSRYAKTHDTLRGEF